jgi:hypothetical protein
VSDINLKYASKEARLFHRAKKEQLRRVLAEREAAALRASCKEVTGHNFVLWCCTICGERSA